MRFFRLLKLSSHAAVFRLPLFAFSAERHWAVKALIVFSRRNVPGHSHPDIREQNKGGLHARKKQTNYFLSLRRTPTLPPPRVFLHEEPVMRHARQPADGRPVRLARTGLLSFVRRRPVRPRGGNFSFPALDSRLIMARCRFRAVAGLHMMTPDACLMGGVGLL